LEWAAASPPPSYNFAAIPVVTSREPLWEPPQDPTQATHVTGLSSQTREVVATTILDARPDHRYTGPASSVWPFLSAVATAAMFIWSIFTPWAVVWGSIPIAIGLIAWFWPHKEETEKHIALEKRP
jgi:cytochrome c oxidase subunit 1